MYFSLGAKQKWAKFVAPFGLRCIVIWPKVSDLNSGRRYSAHPPGDLISKVVQALAEPAKEIDKDTVDHDVATHVAQERVQEHSETDNSPEDLDVANEVVGSGVDEVIEKLGVDAQPEMEANPEDGSVSPVVIEHISVDAQPEIETRPEYKANVCNNGLVPHDGEGGVESPRVGNTKWYDMTSETEGDNDHIVALACSGNVPSDREAEELGRHTEWIEGGAKRKKEKKKKKGKDVEITMNSDKAGMDLATSMPKASGAKQKKKNRKPPVDNTAGCCNFCHVPMWEERRLLYHDEWQACGNCALKPEVAKFCSEGAKWWPDILQ